MLPIYFAVAFVLAAMRPALRITVRNAGIDFLHAAFLHSYVSPLSPSSDHVAFFLASFAVLAFDEKRFNLLKLPVGWRDITLSIPLRVPSTGDYNWTKDLALQSVQNSLDFMFDISSRPFPLRIVYSTCAVGSNDGTEESRPLFTTDLIVRPSTALSVFAPRPTSSAAPSFGEFEGSVYAFGGPSAGLSDIGNLHRIVSLVCPVESFAVFEASVCPVNELPAALNEIDSPRRIVSLMCPIQSFGASEASICPIDGPSAGSSDVDPLRRFDFTMSPIQSFNWFKSVVSLPIRPIIGITAGLSDVTRRIVSSVVLVYGGFESSTTLPLCAISAPSNGLSDTISPPPLVATSTCPIGTRNGIEHLVAVLPARPLARLSAGLGDIAQLIFRSISLPTRSIGSGNKTDHAVPLPAYPLKGRPLADIPVTPRRALPPPPWASTRGRPDFTTSLPLAAIFLTLWILFVTGVGVTMFNHDSSPIPLPAPPTEPIVVDIPDIVNDITDEMSMEPPPSLDKELPKSSSTPAVSYISDDFIAVDTPASVSATFLEIDSKTTLVSPPATSSPCPSFPPAWPEGPASETLGPEIRARLPPGRRRRKRTRKHPARPQAEAA